MAEGINMNGGIGFDETSVTATPNTVRSGKHFLGAGSEDEQTGVLTEVTANTYTVGLNGRQQIPAGIHGGNVVVRQSGIVTMNSSMIYPISQDQTVNTRNKYMIGDVIVDALHGLTPGNIKKGVEIRVADTVVIGTYEGYD